MGAEDGTVWKYDIETGKMDKLLVRCALPVRDIAVSKDREWVAVASEFVDRMAYVIWRILTYDFSELTVKIVNLEDMTNVKYLRHQTKGVKHVSFDPNGRYLAVSCTDGFAYIYSLYSEEPELARKLDGVIRRCEVDDEATSRVVWHPDGTAFVTADAARDISMYSTTDWKKTKVFSGGHNGDVTALGWSSNGVFLVSAGTDGHILLWSTREQKVLQRYDFANVINLAWHPSGNSLSFTTSDGELFIYDNFVSREYEPLLRKPLQAAPIFSVPLTEISDNVKRPMVSKENEDVGPRRRAGTPDSLDDILGSADGMDEFVEDDDEGGYAEDEINPYGKRTNGHLDDLDGRDSKRYMGGGSWLPRVHPPVQPGSTPWRGNRRYLCKCPGPPAGCPLTDLLDRFEFDWCCVDSRSRNSQYRHRGILRPRAAP